LNKWIYIFIYSFIYRSPPKAQTPIKEEEKPKSPKSSPEVKVKKENTNKSSTKTKGNKKTPKSNKKETKNTKITRDTINNKDPKKEEESEPDSPEDKTQKSSKYIKVDAKNENSVCDFFTPSNKNDIELKSAGQGQKGADYNPGKKNYHPIDDAFWERGEKYIHELSIF